MNVDPDSACNYEVNCLTLIAKILQQKESRMDAFYRYLAIISQIVFLAVCLFSFYYLFRIRRILQQVIPGVDWFAKFSDLIRLIKYLDNLSAFPIPDVATTNVVHAESREYMVQMTRDRCSTSSDITVFALEPIAANPDHDNDHASKSKSGDDIHITVPSSTSSSCCHKCDNIKII